MSTYAAPSGPAQASVAVWRTEMPADAAGPVHVVSVDQVVVLTAGELIVDLEGLRVTLVPDDSIVLSAGVRRQVHAGPAGAIAVVASLPGSTARVGDGEPVPVPWAG